MKKILYIITQSEFGGAQRYVFDLATSLSNDFDIIVAAGPPAMPTAKQQRASEIPDGELFRRLTNIQKSNNPKIKAICLKHLKRPINPYHDVLAFFELRRLIKQERPNIIHLNSTKAGILGSLAARSCYVLHAPCYVIYTAHGWVFNEPLSLLRQKFYFYAEKWTTKLKNKIICVSEHDRQVALQNGFLEKKLITVHNGIDFDNLQFLDKKVARQELSKKTHNSESIIHNSSIIGTIANLYPTKGIEYLIKAARVIRENGSRQISDPIFIVIGEGPERKTLEARIRDYRLENSFFLPGHIPEASQYLKAFDLFVLPSVKEGFPYAILEAAAAGLPIIATKVGGIPEILSKELLIEPKNSQELAEKIVYLLKNPNAAKEIGERLQTAVRQRLSLDKMIRETKAAYDSA